MIELVTLKFNYAPWIDQECKDANSRLSSDDGLSHLDKIKSYKTLIQRKKRCYKQEIINNLEQNCNKNPVTFWKLLNGLPSAQRNSDIKLAPEEVCDQIKVLSQIPDQEYFDKDFERQVKEFIKESIDTIKYDLVDLYNYVLSCEKYPDAWGQGLCVAIPKGNKDIRPITIEPIFAKVFETILDNRISFINEAFQKIDRFNGGFLKGSMVQDNLLILTTIIEKQMCLGKPLYFAFVDFKKAFNFVHHDMLFYKLIKTGMTGRFINTLKDMYSKIGAFIKVNNKIYDWVSDTCGTNQGGPLSPNMFRYILSDLKNYLHNEYGVILQDEVIVHLLWADDLVLIGDSPDGLQKQLDGLHRFCSKYQLIVNEMKTKIMLYGKCDNTFNFIFNDKELQTVEEYKYLGVVLNSTKTVRGDIFKERRSEEHTSELQSLTNRGWPHKR